MIRPEPEAQPHTAHPYRCPVFRPSVAVFALSACAHLIGDVVEVFDAVLSRDGHILLVLGGRAQPYVVGRRGDVVTEVQRLRVAAQLQREGEVRSVQVRLIGPAAPGRRSAAGEEEVQVTLQN